MQYTKNCMDDKAYKEGYRAFENGNNEEYNPYSWIENPYLYKSWKIGWAEACLKNINIKKHKDLCCKNIYLCVDTD